ncbi:LPXTG cell wall anchor domain-containing protein, partial [Streptococcus sp. 339]
TKASAAYYNEQDPDKKRAYDAAVQAGKDVLAKANPTQAEVDQAKAAIDQAKAALTGSETNTAALSAASNTEADATKASAALPNTGSRSDSTTAALGLLSIFGAVGLLFSKKKKDDEEA